MNHNCRGHEAVKKAWSNLFDVWEPAHVQWFNALGGKGDKKNQQAHDVAIHKPHTLSIVFTALEWLLKTQQLYACGARRGIEKGKGMEIARKWG